MSEKSKIKRLFISKSVDELELLPSFCSENNIHLTAYSFLSFEAVAFQLEYYFDIVFLASPRAAHFFLSQVDCSEKLIAVAGESTRKYVEQQNLIVHFSPKNSGNIVESSIEFARWTSEKKVLFPVSNLSKKSYSNHLQNNNFETILCYKTQISTEKIEIYDIYVFTSPSNVTGFLALNSFPSTAKIVAWGETTYNELRSIVATEKLYLLEQSSEENLIVLLEELRCKI